jgi:hypothetical protein
MSYWQSIFYHIGFPWEEQNIRSSPVILPFWKVCSPKDDLTTDQKMTVFKFIMNIEESKYIEYETSDNGA